MYKRVSATKSKQVVKRYRSLSTGMQQIFSSCYIRMI
jgi:hypothetical protein